MLKLLVCVDRWGVQSTNFGCSDTLSGLQAPLPTWARDLG